jgi:prephenate dehydrogenase
MAPLFDNVAIIGVGLLGGSLGLALREGRLARRVVGVGHRQESIDKAVAMGAVDEATLDPGAGVEGADLVVLCTAVRLIPVMAADVASRLKPGCIVTDVGSTKSFIVSELERILGGRARFVGSHPIAGSEKRGVDAARADLFRGAVCVVTPGERTDDDASNRVASLWHAVGAKVVTLGPAEHDAILARTSHLPHIIATLLVLMLQRGDQGFAGPGFRDTTRIASGDPDIWLDIVSTNHAAILDALNFFSTRIDDLRRAISHGDANRIRDILAQAKAQRDRMFPGNDGQ